jgi:hypothetical protein
LFMGESTFFAAVSKPLHVIQACRGFESLPLR